MGSLLLLHMHGLARVARGVPPTPTLWGNTRPESSVSSGLPWILGPVGSTQSPNRDCSRDPEQEVGAPVPVGHSLRPAPSGPWGSGWLGENTGACAEA